MKSKEMPSYQVAPTIGELIEALKKWPKDAPWTTDSLAGNGYYSVTVYDKDGNNPGQVLNKK